MEVRTMRVNPKTGAALETEATEEIIGVLTAISVVSKRLAKKLALLEKSPPKERRPTVNGTAEATGPSPP